MGHAGRAGKTSPSARDSTPRPRRYFQLLHRSIDTAEALEAKPMLVRRLRRRRDAGRAETSRRHAS
ncbi:DUF3263 domain-containing protein [Microbacterium sp. CFBP 13617]|uniref:DUF3263 domain-containing protein n=1 Tax=Microbacterium sp. CFBP 13617 TaxID=2774035 RepID=UPI00406D11FE